MSSAEYYFDYKVEKVWGDETIVNPKMYFERDYKNSSLSYSLFIVPGEWIDKHSVMKEFSGAATKSVSISSDALEVLKYDTVEVVFDMKGINCSPLLDEKSEEYINAEKSIKCTFENFYRSGCKIILENDDTFDHSGIGVINMKKHGESVAKFFFAINFTFRKKIYYSLSVSAGKLSVKYECSSRPVGVKTKVVFAQDRIPCLKNDMGTNIVAEHTLDFDKSDVYAPEEAKLSAQAKDVRNIFSVTFQDEKMARFYLLECKENSTIKINHTKPKENCASYTCPYCHTPIDRSIMSDSNYLRYGGAGCQLKDGKPYQGPIVLGEHDQPVSRCLYCSHDLVAGERFDVDFTRLLPAHFLEHSSFKIAFTGAPRSGKTTYISRFFNITGGEDTAANMTMAMIGNALSQFKIDIQSVFVPQLEFKDGREYRSTKKDWAMSQKFYTDRIINCYPSVYPNSTESLSDAGRDSKVRKIDPQANPFIAEINKHTYVSFYDISGEDATAEVQIEKVAADDNSIIGIFLIINGNLKSSENEKIVEKLMAANISGQCPVAVIINKMDMIEEQFDSNAHCLRTDYFDSGKGYAESALEAEVDMSSIEIESFIRQNNLMPQIESKFSNVKYFGVSSFNFFDSIHAEGESADEPPKNVKFECSSKRLELPFIWLLYQLGIIG